MCCPSGDHRGRPTNGNSSVVNCVGFEPSLSDTQTAGCPERLELNTIFFPSGEYSAVRSERVEVISLTGV
jgi:hypothetical protein